jgi:hypothetical protein
VGKERGRNVKVLFEGAKFEVKGRTGNIVK